MDIELARTFIEIVSAGSFIGASNRLNVTQSTVSTRVRTLEEQLGRQLFVRKRSGVGLTPAGEQFQRYAMTLTQTWEQACHHISLPTGFSDVLSIGGQFSLWDGLLMNWLPWMRAKAPDISLRAEYGQSDRLMLRLSEGLLDIGVMYTPQSRPSLKVEPLIEEELILVTAGDETEPSGDANYVYMDWGPEFRSGHSLQLPQLSNSGTVLNLGSLGIKYILQNGGSGYFPRRLALPFLDSGLLKIIEGTPTFSHPAYVVYAIDGNSKLLELALEGLRSLAAETLRTDQ